MNLFDIVDASQKLDKMNKQLISKLDEILKVLKEISGKL